MRKESVKGVVWMTYDTGIKKNEAVMPPAYQWMRLPEMSEIKSFPTDIVIQPSPRKLYYYSFFLLLMAVTFSICYGVAQTRYGKPKPVVTVTPTPKRPEIALPEKTVVTVPEKARPSNNSNVLLPDEFPGNGEKPQESTSPKAHASRTSPAPAQKPVTIIIPQLPPTAPSAKTGTHEPAVQINKSGTTKRKIQRID